MKIRLNLDSLHDSISRLGAKPVAVTLQRFRPVRRTSNDIDFGYIFADRPADGDKVYPPAKELDGLLEVGGLEVELSNITTNSENLLEFEGRPVTIHIANHSGDFDRAVEDGSLGKKVHFSECRTIREQRSAGRIHRYVPRTGTSANFEIFEGISLEKAYRKGHARLVICQNCLEEVNFQNFRDIPIGPKRENFRRELSLVELFETHSAKKTSPVPLSELNKPTPTYTVDWKTVSRNYRAKQHWICEGCRVDLKNSQYLLHSHHIDGDKSNNSDSNLKALCADCHSREKNHHTMYVSPAARNEIQRLRVAPEVTDQNSHVSSDIGWEESMELADPVVHEVLAQARNLAMPAPECGIDIKVPRKGVVGNAELAWPDRAVAILIDETGREEMEKNGWTVYTVSEAKRAIDQKQCL